MLSCLFVGTFVLLRLSLGKVAFYRRLGRTIPPSRRGSNVPAEAGVPPANAVGYNAPQDGKYSVEAGNGGAGARSGFRVAERLRTDYLPEQAGRGASRPVRLRELRLSRVG